MRRRSVFQRLSPMEELKLKTDYEWAAITNAFYNKLSIDQRRKLVKEEQGNNER